MKPTTITIILAVSAVFFFTSYIFFASTMSSLGYELGKKEAELINFNDLENELIVELAQKQNPDYISSQSQNLNLVEISSVSRYIDTRVSALGRAE